MHSNAAQFLDQSGHFRADSPQEPIKLKIWTDKPLLSRIELRALNPRNKHLTDADRIAVILEAIPAMGSIGAKEIQIKVRFGNDYLYSLLRKMVQRKQIFAKKVSGVLSYSIVR